MNKADFLKVSGGIFESDKSWSQINSFSKKSFFWDIYTNLDGAHGIYSGAPLKDLVHKKQYSIEHIIPKSFLLESLANQPKKIRYGATLNPFNLAPAHQKINRIRGDAQYDFDGDPITKTFHVKFKSVHQDQIGFDEDREWSPPRKSRGDIARAILYMNICYSLRCYSKTDLDTLIHWAKADEPSRVEVKYSQWIKQKMGIQNPFIDIPELIEDEELYVIMV